MEAKRSKTPMYCQENHKFEKRRTQFSLIQVGQSFKCLVHLVIQSLGRFYKNSVLKKVKEFYNKKQPSKGWSGVLLLHDNASSHKCEVFLASEKVKVLNHPPYSPYSPDLSPCDFFLFPRLKKMLSGNKYMYTSRSSLRSTIYQCLQQTPKKDYLSAFRDWVKRLQKCISVKGEYFEGL